MTKNKTIATACGGVFALAVLAGGYFLYDAYSTCAEQQEELDGQIENVRSINNAPVFPSKKSIDAVKANAKQLLDWRESALTLAAGGDKKFDATESPALFKQRLQGAVKRMSALPGGVAGKLVAENFYFGFDRYLGENATLPEQAAVLKLATQLDLVETLVDICAKAGAVQVKRIALLEPPKTDDDSSARKGKKAKDAEAGPTVLEYEAEVDVRPTAFVSLLNELTAAQRFIVVKNFAFAPAEDKLLSRLGAKDESATASAGSSRRRGRRRGAEPEPEKKADAAQAGGSVIITDPEAGEPITVKLTLAVYDFGKAV